MDKHSVSALNDDELDTIRITVERDWRFTPDPRFIRRVLEEDSASRLTIKGCRHYGWFTTGVPEVLLNDFARALTGANVPTNLDYDAWVVWRTGAAEAHAEWVRKAEESTSDRSQ